MCSYGNEFRQRQIPCVILLRKGQGKRGVELESPKSGLMWKTVTKMKSDLSSKLLLEKVFSKKTAQHITFELTCDWIVPWLECLLIGWQMCNLVFAFYSIYHFTCNHSNWKTKAMICISVWKIISVVLVYIGLHLYCVLDFLFTCEP